MFVELEGLDGLSEWKTTKNVEIVFEVSRLPESMPSLPPTSVLLNCTPAVNLFAHDADPIRVNHERTEYRLRPSGNNPEHYEISSISSLTGLVRGVAKPREYKPFFSFSRREGEEVAFYRVRLESAVATEGTDVYVTFLHGKGADALQDVETISTELTCSNRRLPARLRVGDLSV